MSIQIVNIRQTDYYDIYIGRKPGQPHHYGNPFIVGRDGDQAEVIEKFRLWLLGLASKDYAQARREWILDNIEQLRGKVLGCHCRPLPCHGDVYKEVLDG